LNIPLVIGYNLEKALQLIGNDYEIIVEKTLTIYEDKKNERQGNQPIVVRQVILDEKVVLTTSLFG
jgi:hypothetical protein